VKSMHDPGDRISADVLCILDSGILFYDLRFEISPTFAIEKLLQRRLEVVIIS